MRRIALTAAALMAVAIVSLGMTTVVRADTGVTVRIDQQSPRNLGTWSLVRSSGAVVTSQDKGIDPKSQTFTGLEATHMSFLVIPPQGLSAKIMVYKNNTLIDTVTTLQTSITPAPGDQYRFIVLYAVSSSNIVVFGITSNPNGVPVTIRGPEKIDYKAKTPHTFRFLPPGKYTITVGMVKGCYASPVYSRNLSAGKRETINIDIPCKDKNGDSYLKRGPTKRKLQEQAKIQNNIRANQRRNGK